MFCNEGNTRRILKATQRMNRTEHFYWLASDSWGAKLPIVQGLEHVAEAAITILPEKKIIPEFDRYFLALTLSCRDNSNVHWANRIPWLRIYWEQLHNCDCGSGRNPKMGRCNDMDPQMLAHTYKQEGLIQFVVDSVNAVAHAVRNMQKIYCGETFIGLCSNLKKNIYNGTVLRDFIQNVTFYGISRTPVEFNEQGGVEGTYEVYQFRKDDKGLYEYYPTGNLDKQKKLRLHNPQERGAFCDRGPQNKNNKYTMPTSYCSDLCPTDQGYEYASEERCCWHCERCHKDHYLNKSTLECEPCPDTQLQSSTDVSLCESIRFVHIDWTIAWPCIPLVLASLGLVFNILITYTFVRYQNHRAIKASGRENSALLLIGLTMTFSTILLQTLWPDRISCTIMRLGMPVSLTLCYASIFTKTHRIYRIFLPSLTNMIHRPPFISPQSQIVMSLLCTGVSCLLSIVCLTLEPPNVEYLTHNLPETIVKCQIRNTTFFVTFIYDVLVIIATTFLAWQVRSIPENFNEAKYIAFLMFSSCVLWMGLMPVYFLVTSNFTVQMTSFLLCITLSANDIQVCMFAPKLYMVYTGNDDPLNRKQKMFRFNTAARTSNNSISYSPGPLPNNPESLLQGLPKALERDYLQPQHAADLALAILSRSARRPSSIVSFEHGTGGTIMETTSPSASGGGYPVYPVASPSVASVKVEQATQCEMAGKEVSLVFN